MDTKRGAGGIDPASCRFRATRVKAVEEDVVARIDFRVLVGSSRAEAVASDGGSRTFRPWLILLRYDKRHVGDVRERV